MAVNAVAAPPAAPTWRTALAWLAPPYLLGFALLRSWLEMSHLAARPSFAYYVGLHHVCWYASTMLAIVLVVHLVLRRPVGRLLPLMYGITLSAIPLGWAVATGEPLRLEYLMGTPRELLLHVLTFSASYRRNLPLVAEVVCIFLGMLVLGRILGGTWRRGLLLAVTVHVTLAAMGLAWFGPGPHAIVTIPSALTRKQPLQALCWVHVLSACTALLLWRAGVLSAGRRSWALAGIVGAETWIAWVLVAGTTGWFRRPFDLAATALPLVTCAVILTRAARGDRRLVPRGAWASMALLLAVQVAVVVPIATHQERRLLRPKGHVPVVAPARPSDVR